MFRLYFSYCRGFVIPAEAGIHSSLIDSRLRGNDIQAGVAKLADALALGASTARYAGSSPVPGTFVFLSIESAFKNRFLAGLVLLSLYVIPTFRHT